MVRSCNCTHLPQDEIYGKGMRLMNKTDKGVRCTVCGKDVLITESTPSKKKK